MVRRTTGARRLLGVLLAGLVVAVGSLLPVTADAAERGPWEIQRVRAVTKPGGILYEPIGDGPFKSSFGAGLWVGDASKRPQGATQSLGVKDEILFTRQFKDQAHVKSAGGNEGVFYANTTACRIGGISFDFPTGQTLTKVEVGKGDRTATSGITDGTIRNLLVLFNPPVAQGEYIWLRTPALTVADKIKYKLVFVENDPCAKDVMAAPQPGGDGMVALQALPLPDDDVAAAVSQQSTDVT